VCGIDEARAHARSQAGAAVLFLIPIVHRPEHGIALMDRNYRTFGQHIEVFVGYDRRDFDDEVGFRLQAGHFQVDPNQIIGGFHGVIAPRHFLMNEASMLAELASRHA
jgi:hypothetical protein